MGKWFPKLSWDRSEKVLKNRKSKVKNVGLEIGRKWSKKG